MKTVFVVLTAFAAVVAACVMALFVIGCKTGPKTAASDAATVRIAAAGPDANAPIIPVPLPVVTPDPNGLQSADADTRQRAASQMGETANAQDGDALLAALPSEKDWSVRASIVRGIGKQYLQCPAFQKRGADRLLTPLLHELDTQLAAEHAGLRLEVVRALDWIADRRAMHKLIPLLDDADDHVQQQTMKTLGKIGDARQLPRFVHVMQTSSNLWTRYDAVSALRQMGDRQAVMPLIAALDSEKDPQPRRAIALALGKLGDKAAVPVLIAHLKDADTETRFWTICALAELRDPSALSALQEVSRTDRASGNGQPLSRTADRAMRFIRTGSGKVNEYE